MKLKLCHIAILCSLSVSTAAVAEIYKWTDRQGKVHFTDSPPGDQQVEEVEVKVKVNSYTAVTTTPLVERLGRKDKVVMYTASWCGICKKAGKYFKKNSIPYIAYDIEKSRRGKMGYKLLKGRGVPIVIINDKRMNGFNVAKFEKLYKQEMQERTSNDNLKEGV